MAKQWGKGGLLALVLLTLNGCFPLDLRDPGEKNVERRAIQHVAFTAWKPVVDRKAPTLVFYGKGYGRLLDPEEGATSFEWKMLGDGKYASVSIPFDRQKAKTAVFSANYTKMRFDENSYRIDYRVRPIMALIEAQQLTGGLIFEAALILVVLVFGANVIVFFQKISDNLKRWLRLHGSEIMYYLNHENPRYVSVNGSKPMKFMVEKNIIHAGGMHCNVENANFAEGGETPLFVLATGTQLRFYKDDKSLPQ